MTPNEPQQIDLIYFISSGLVYTVIFTSVVLYFVVWKNKSIPVLLIIAIMLINQLLQAMCEMLGYIGNQSSLICSISLIGRTSFTISAIFWVIFITRIIYREKLAPGKYLNMFKYVSRNILITYTPSLFVSVFLVIIININDSDSQDSCWTIPKKKSWLDYIIYYTCFVIPYFIGSIILSMYLVWYVRLPKFSFNLFLVFPIASISFSLYYASVKIYLFAQQIQSPNIIELPVITQSLIYSIVFIMLCKLKVKKQVDDDTLTLKDDSFSQSFLEN